MSLEHTNKKSNKIVKIRTIEIKNMKKKEIKEEILKNQKKLTNLEETKKTINVEEKEIEEVNSEPLEIEKRSLPRIIKSYPTNRDYL